jgi:protein SCO1
VMPGQNSSRSRSATGLWLTFPATRAVSMGVGIWAVLLLTCAGLCQAAESFSEPSLRLSAWPAGVATPRLNLMDVNGHRRALESFRGFGVVVYFGFVSCPEQCPAVLFKLAQVVKSLGPARQQVRVLFVTLDPEHDSARRLKQYVRAFDPDFVGLTGTSAMVNKAATDFFVQYARVRRNGGETIDHSSGLFLIDPSGRLRAVGSAESAVDDLVHDLGVLVPAPAQ